MRYWFGIGLLSISLSMNVLAGEMGAVQTLPLWNGLYLGGQLGGAWARQSWHYNNYNYFNTIQTELLGTNFNFNAQNVIGGGYLGWNYQATTAWLLGVEGSFSGSRLNREIDSPFFATDRYTSSMNEMGAIKGRVGYSYAQWLPYVTGGWASGNTSLTLASAPYGVLGTTTPWNNGWIAGAGIEYRATSKLALGLSYDYWSIALNNQSMLCPNCGVGVGNGTPLLNGDFKTQAVMARITYLASQ